MATKEALKALKLICKMYDKKGIRYTLNEERSFVSARYDADNYKDVTFYIFVDDDGNSVAVRAFSLSKFDGEQIPVAYAFCNEMNRKYRWMRFYLDNENELTAAMDAVIEPKTAGEECYELLGRSVSIVDDVIGALKA